MTIECVHGVEWTELAERQHHGIAVTLYWAPATNVLAVTVADAATGDYFELVLANNEPPLDVFYHPYAYARRRGVVLLADAHEEEVALIRSVGYTRLTTRIGFVGLGHMGGNMAARFLAAGYAVDGEQRNREHARGLVDAELQWRETPREVAESADIVFTSLPDDGALTTVASGPDGILAGLTAGKSGSIRARSARARAASSQSEFTRSELPCWTRRCRGASPRPATIGPATARLKRTRPKTTRAKTTRAKTTRAKTTRAKRARPATTRPATEVATTRRATGAGDQLRAGTVPGPVPVVRGLSPGLSPVPDGGRGSAYRQSA